MTNSRLTDPEVLEWRFPVLLESFAFALSGGNGHHHGGNGHPSPSFSQNHDS